MKKYIVPFAVILTVIISTHLLSSSFFKSQIEREQLMLNNEQGKNRYNEDLFSLYSNVIGKSLDSLLWKHHVDTVSMDDCVSYPCLLIYIPPLEKLCMSCTNYAISSVQKIYCDKWETAQIGILTCGYNGELKERFLKKKVYSTEKDYFSIENFNYPVYLLIDKNKRVISSFMPYENNYRWTDKYLKSVRCLLKP